MSEVWPLRWIKQRWLFQTEYIILGCPQASSIDFPWVSKRLTQPSVVWSIFNLMVNHRSESWREPDPRTITSSGYLSHVSIMFLSANHHNDGLLHQPNTGNQLEIENISVICTMYLSVWRFRRHQLEPHPNGGSGRQKTLGIQMDNWMENKAIKSVECGTWNFLRLDAA